MGRLEILRKSHLTFCLVFYILNAIQRLFRRLPNSENVLAELDSMNIIPRNEF